MQTLYCLRIRECTKNILIKSNQEDIACVLIIVNVMNSTSLLYSYPNVKQPVLRDHKSVQSIAGGCFLNDFLFFITG